MLHIPADIDKMVGRGPGERCALADARPRAVSAGGEDLLVPESERAEGGLVVELEEAGRLGGGRVVVLDPVPGRRNERISAFPRQPCLADPALSGSLDDVEDG